MANKINKEGLVILIALDVLVRDKIDLAGNDLSVYFSKLFELLETQKAESVKKWVDR